MSILVRTKSMRQPKAVKKTVRLMKKTFKFEITPEDIALDNAISAAAARSLAKRTM